MARNVMKHTRLQRWYVTIPSLDQWKPTIEKPSLPMAGWPKTIEKPSFSMVASNHSIQWWWCLWKPLKILNGSKTWFKSPMTKTIWWFWLSFLHCNQPTLNLRRILFNCTVHKKMNIYGLVIAQDFLKRRTNLAQFRLCHQCPAPQSQKGQPKYTINCEEHNLKWFCLLICQMFL